MSAEAIVLQVVVWLPLLGAILIAALGSMDSRTPRNVAAWVSGLALLLSVWLFLQFNRAAPASFQFDSRFLFVPQIGSDYRLGVDGISLPLLVLNTLLSFLAVLISWNVSLRPQLYFALLLVLETAVSGVFTALDLFVFFLFWELELAPMYLLIGVWGGPRREYAAMKFIIYTVVGSAFMLVGILGLYFWTGRSFDMTAISQSARTLAPSLQVLFFLLMGIAFAVKLPVFPFHTWLPDAHVEAPTPVSVLLAGVLLKMGGYGLLRLCVNLLPDAARQLALLLAVLAVINILYGAAVALAQTDLKKMIANSSISHMGYVLLGIAALSQIGFQGAVVQMVTHGTITGLLFMMVGLVYDRTHTREIPRMAGLAVRMPLIATVFVIAGLASLGLPGLSGFVGEFLVFIGAYPVWQLYTILGAFAIVVTAGYLLWMLERVFMGPLPAEWREAHLSDASPLETFAVGTLVAVIVLVGVYPNVIADLIGGGVVPIARLFG